MPIRRGIIPAEKQKAYISVVEISYDIAREYRRRF
jgi:hypothetical protein